MSAVRRGDTGPPESGEELVEFVRHAPVGLCWVSSDGRVLWANETLEELLGCSTHELVDHTMAEFLIEPRAALDILSQLQRQHAVKAYEASLRTRNGAILRVLIGASNLRRGEEIIHGRWVIRDITRLIEREQAARHRALDSGRLKDEFLALLSHELRSPLGAILVWLGLLRQNPADPAETTRALEIIERSARTLERIIEDLLHASRIAAGGLMLTPQLVDLRAVVHVATDAASGDATLKSLSLDSTVDDLPIWVIGDPGRLQQALSNVLSNAIKFTPAGGRIEVSLAIVDGKAQLRVVDTGEGMTSAFLPFAFERFRQQDSSSTRVHHGLGLGLYVVRHVIGHHGGFVTADSPGHGRGSTFTIVLPLAAAPAEVASAPPALPAASVAEGNSTGLSVLLVDDEEDAREALRLILQQNGMLVTTAASAREAFDLLERLQPGILLSDIAMPGEDGLTLIRRVRLLPFDQGGQTPAIALSAYAGVEDRRKALLAGFQRHIPKPVDPTHLLAAIAAVTRRTGGGRTEAPPRSA